MLKKISKNFFKNKANKYLVIGGFTFFFIKGLIWLGIFIFAGFNFINFN